jgi:hypothetical protein
MEAAKQAEVQHLNRQLSTWVDDDGMVVIRGRPTPEVGAVVQRALEAAADRLFRETAPAPSGNVMSEELTFGQRRADALGLLAETLAADLDAGTAGDRYLVVLHVNAESVEPHPAAPSTPDAAAATFDGAIELDHGALYVSAETSRRIACDASTVHMHHDADGDVIESSRKTRRFRQQFAAPSLPATPVAASRAARRAAVTHTTSSIGPTTATPASRTWCCCVGAIIEPYTRADLA